MKWDLHVESLVYATKIKNPVLAGNMSKINPFTRDADSESNELKETLVAFCAKKALEALLNQNGHIFPIRTSL